MSAVGGPGGPSNIQGMSSQQPDASNWQANLANSLPNQIPQSQAKGVAEVLAKTFPGPATAKLTAYVQQNAQIDVSVVKADINDIQAQLPPKAELAERFQAAANAPTPKGANTMDYESGQLAAMLPLAQSQGLSTIGNQSITEIQTRVANQILQADNQAMQDLQPPLGPGESLLPQTAQGLQGLQGLEQFDSRAVSAIDSDFSSGESKVEAHPFGFQKNVEATPPTSHSEVISKVIRELSQ